MATYSKLKQILRAVQGIVLGLGFTDPQTGVQIPVYLRNVPRSQVGLDDALAAIYVYRSDAPEEYKRMAFGGNDSITFLIYIVVLSPGNQDYDTNISTYDVWRDQIAEPPWRSAASSWRRRRVGHQDRSGRVGAKAADQHQLRLAGGFFADICREVELAATFTSTETHS